MEGFFAHDSLYISVENLAELRALIEQAQAQLHELEDTLSKLKAYDLEINFSEKKK